MSTIDGQTVCYTMHMRLCPACLCALYMYNNCGARLYSSFNVCAGDTHARFCGKRQCNEMDAGIIADYFLDGRISFTMRKSVDPQSSCMPVKCVADHWCTKLVETPVCCTRWLHVMHRYAFENMCSHCPLRWLNLHCVTSSVHHVHICLTAIP